MRKVLNILLILTGIEVVVVGLLASMSTNVGSGFSKPLTVIFFASVPLFFVLGTGASFAFISSIITQHRTALDLRGEDMQQMSKAEMLVGAISVVVILASTAYPFVCSTNGLIPCVA